MRWWQSGAALIGEPSAGPGGNLSSPDHAVFTHGDIELKNLRKRPLKVRKARRELLRRKSDILFAI